jgi:hypothetical protein
LRGKITGNVIAREKIEIKSKTELFGDGAPKLVIEEGVTCRKSEVNPNKVASSSPPPALRRPPRKMAHFAEPAKAGRFSRPTPRCTH